MRTVSSSNLLAGSSTTRLLATVCKRTLVQIHFSLWPRIEGGDVVKRDSCLMVLMREHHMKGTTTTRLVIGDYY